MNEKLENLIQELKIFFNKEFHKNYFTIIYGSYAYGVNTSNSDLDFVTVSKNPSHENLGKTLDFVFDLYQKYNLAFDDEVPHEKKLLASYQTLDDAVEGRGFERKGGRIYVPPIVKSREFLHSDEIMMRLLLNAITSKNIFVSGDINHYSKKRKQAIKNMVGFMFSVDNVDSFTIAEFVQSLIGTTERFGEMYLGYKDKPAVRGYLTETFRKEFERLAYKDFLERDVESDRYTLINASWLGKLID